MFGFKKSLFTITFGLSSIVVLSQERIMSNNKDTAVQSVTAVFKALRLVNAQTTETTPKKCLVARISHRFGNMYNSDLPNALNTSGQSFFGLDEISDVRFGFDYGLTNNITIGLGRSQLNHIIDGNLKWKILKQTDDFRVPVSLTVFSSTGYTHDPSTVMYSGIIKDFPTNELHRFSYFNQLIIACKLNNRLVVELLPSYMHRNFIKERLNTSNNSYDVNGFFSLGFGAGLKLTKHLSVTGDYFYNINPFYQNNSGARNPLAFGFEIESGKQVINLFFSNAAGLIENNFIPYTTDSWAKGQIKFGFSISRTFAL